MDSRTRVSSLYLLKQSGAAWEPRVLSIPLHGCCCRCFCSCVQVWQVFWACVPEGCAHTRTEDFNMAGNADYHRQGALFSSSTMNTNSAHIKQPSPAAPLWLIWSENPPPTLTLSLYTCSKHGRNSLSVTITMYLFISAKFLFKYFIGKEEKRKTFHKGHKGKSVSLNAWRQHCKVMWVFSPKYEIDAH